LYDRERNVRIAFLFNFNKTFALLPHGPKPTKDQLDIIKGFVKNMQEELFVLIKQRYVEAKAYGEKNPLSYLEFEPGRFVNYMEMFPKNSQLLDFSFENKKYFAEDAYDMDSRVANKTVQLTFYPCDSEEENQDPLFNYTYYFDELKREDADNKLDRKENDVLVALNQFVPNLYDILKMRYKQVKKLGKELMGKGPRMGVVVEKESPDAPRVKKKKKRVLN